MLFPFPFLQLFESCQLLVLWIRPFQFGHSHFSLGSAFTRKQDVKDRNKWIFNYLSTQRAQPPSVIISSFISHSVSVQSHFREAECSAAKAEQKHTATPIPQSTLLNKVVLHLSCPCSSGKKLKAATHWTQPCQGLSCLLPKL